MGSESLIAARTSIAVEADVREIADALNTGKRLADEAHERHDTKRGLYIDGALAALERLSGDATLAKADARQEGLLSDVLSWIENYPLSDRSDTKDEWRALVARIRDQALDAVVLGPIVVREMVRLIDAGSPDVAATTGRSFLEGLARDV